MSKEWGIARDGAMWVMDSKLHHVNTKAIQAAPGERWTTDLKILIEKAFAMQRVKFSDYVIGFRVDAFRSCISSRPTQQ